jgi:hypothetical protein
MSKVTTSAVHCLVALLAVVAVVGKVIQVARMERGIKIKVRGQWWRYSCPGREEVIQVAHVVGQGAGHHLYTCLRCVYCQKPSPSYHTGRSTQRAA